MSTSEDLSTFEDEVRASIRAIADHTPQLGARADVPAAAGRRWAPVVVVGSIAAAVALVAFGVELLPAGGSGPVTVAADGEVPPGAATLPPGPLSPRIGEASAWTGHEWLIWGGEDDANHVLHDGAAYDPATRRWTVLPRAPLQGGVRLSEWTGQEWILFTGTDDHPFADGAAYVPATRRWQRLPAPPASLADPDNGPAEAVWTGTAMIVIADEGTASFQPATERWTTLPAFGQAAATATLSPNPAVWTGTEAVFLLGVPEVPSAPRVPSAPGAPPVGTPATLLPVISSGVSTPALHFAQPDGPLPYGRGLHLGAYDPRTGRWTLLPDGGLEGDSSPEIAWTGSALLAIDRWDHDGGAAVTGTDASYSFATKRWTSLPAVPARTGYPGSTAVWTGSSVLLWEGGPTGYVYRPSTNTWSTFTGVDRAGLGMPVSAWTGTAMLVWGERVDAHDDPIPADPTGLARYTPTDT